MSIPLTVPDESSVVVVPIVWFVVYVPVNWVDVLSSVTSIVVKLRAYSPPSASNTRLMYCT